MEIFEQSDREVEVDHRSTAMIYQNETIRFLNTKDEQDNIEGAMGINYICAELEHHAQKSYDIARSMESWSRSEMTDERIEQFILYLANLIRHISEVNDLIDEIIYNEALDG